MEQVNFLWTIGLVVIGTVVWFIRLEGRIIYLERDHEKLVEQGAKTTVAFDTKLDRLSNDLLEIRVMLARVEGSLKKSED